MNMLQLALTFWVAILTALNIFVNLKLGIGDKFINAFNIGAWIGIAYFYVSNIM